ncbi:hypothetical protein DFJ73DRAFT_799891 [Zopfochytrium polystomum]|nr:hypothetical protein DFJ73DRAFT_799891 [Zopfochytrium polystomum]
MAAATFDELRQALIASLESRGVIADLTAKVRAEIFNCLDEGIEAPAQARETEIVNALILEYLRWQGYESSASVFAAEANVHTKKAQPSLSLSSSSSAAALLSLSDEELADELGVNAAAYPQNVPLLYGLVFKNSSRATVERVVAPRAISLDHPAATASAAPFAETRGGGLAGLAGGGGVAGRRPRPQHQRLGRQGWFVGDDDDGRDVGDSSDVMLEAGFFELSKSTGPGL